MREVRKRMIESSIHLPWPQVPVPFFLTNVLRISWLSGRLTRNKTLTKSQFKNESHGPLTEHCSSCLDHCLSSLRNVLRAPVSPSVLTPLSALPPPHPPSTMTCLLSVLELELLSHYESDKSDSYTQQGLTNVLETAKTICCVCLYLFMFHLQSKLKLWSHIVKFVM